MGGHIIQRVAILYRGLSHYTEGGHIEMVVTLYRGWSHRRWSHYTEGGHIIQWVRQYELARNTVMYDCQAVLNYISPILTPVIHCAAYMGIHRASGVHQDP